MTASARERHLWWAASAVALVMLTGCAPPTPSEPAASPGSASETPSASPEPDPEIALPSRPALDELELSAEGLGTLAFGQPPVSDPELRMVFFDPIGCTDDVTGEPIGIVAGDPLAGAWFVDPAYASAPTAESNGQPFGVAINPDAGNALERIDLYSDQIPTDGGVRIGDDRADVVAGHPGATVVESYLTDIYVVTGTNGILQIEVASRSDAEKDAYWDSVAIPDGRVMYIHAVTIAGGVFSVAASGNIVGGCNFG